MPTRDACGSSSGSARVPAHIRSAHNAWDARLTVGESSRERHHVEPRRRFLPWPPRLVSATRRGAAEAEASPAALETSRRPGRALTKLRALGEAKRPPGREAIAGNVQPSCDPMLRSCLPVNHARCENILRGIFSPVNRA